MKYSTFFHVILIFTLLSCNKEFEEKVICENTCTFSNDGECDDGGESSDTDYCKIGTDCNDCGERIVKERVK